MNLDELYALEHSQYSEDEGKFCFHYEPLTSAIEKNLTDYRYNDREANKWQIIFVGSSAECVEFMETLIFKKNKRRHGNLNY